MHNRVLNLSICIISLLIGGWIYIVFRPNSHVALLFYEIFSISWDKPLKFGFVEYYLTDYFWGLSFSCGLSAIFEKGRKQILMSVSIMLFTGIIWEFFQKIDVLNGTGDIIDIIMYVWAGVTAYFINTKGEKHESIA